MSPDAALQDITHTIQLAIAPVFLLSALGTTLGVLTTRLGRVVDRARRLETHAGHSEAERDDELRGLARRARLIHFALTSATSAALCVCVLIATAFVGYLFDVPVAVPVAVLFIAAMGAFMLALIFFLREVVSAIGSLQFRVPVPPDPRTGPEVDPPR